MRQREKHWLSDDGSPDTLGDWDCIIVGAPVTVGLMLGWLDGTEDTEGWLDGCDVRPVETLGPNDEWLDGSADTEK